MSWKDLNKSSYNIPVNKFQEWVPSRPFSVPLDGNKVRYSEGDEITTADNIIFNVDFTGVPLGNTHIPCGYWHKNYIPNVYVVYTSKIYPIYDVDYVGVVGDIISGSLNTVYDLYEIPDEGINVIGTIVDGVFRLVYKTYSTQSEGLTFAGSITGGILDQIYYTYSVGSEGLNISGAIINGVLDILLIQYSNWPPEQLTISGTITGGSHVSV